MWDYFAWFSRLAVPHFFNWEREDKQVRLWHVQTLHFLILYKRVRFFIFVITNIDRSEEISIHILKNIIEYKFIWLWSCYSESYIETMFIKVSIKGLKITMFSGRGIIVRSVRYLRNLRQTNYKSLFLLLCWIDRVSLHVSFTRSTYDKILRTRERERDFAINSM